jgi:hypothetical protein
LILAITLPFLEIPIPNVCAVHSMPIIIYKIKKRYI